MMISWIAWLKQYISDFVNGHTIEPGYNSDKDRDLRVSARYQRYVKFKYNPIKKPRKPIMQGNYYELKQIGAFEEE